MNINQAHKEFQLFVDKVDTQSLPDFLPHEIDTFIHEAELRIVKQAYGGNNIYKTGIGQSQKRIDDIHTLFRTVEVDILENVAILPEDYMILDRVMVQVSNDRVNPTYTAPYMCSHDKLNTVLSDPFNKSTIAYPIMWQENNSLHVDAPDFEVSKVKVSYIKYPVRVNKAEGVGSELPEQKQREAIQLAVRIALGVTENQVRIQDQTQQLGGVE